MGNYRHNSQKAEVCFLFARKFTLARWSRCSCWRPSCSATDEFHGITEKFVLFFFVMG
jgi:hypothetical protein